MHSRLFAVPLEPIRHALDNKGINGLKPFSRFVLLGYDYLITTADAKAGVSLYEEVTCDELGAGARVSCSCSCS